MKPVDKDLTLGMFAAEDDVGAYRCAFAGVGGFTVEGDGVPGHCWIASKWRSWPGLRTALLAAWASQPMRVSAVGVSHVSISFCCAERISFSFSTGLQD